LSQEFAQGARRRKTTRPVERDSTKENTERLEQTLGVKAKS